MEIRQNFLSIITLGSFNPAILTPEFLKDQGIWLTEEIPKGTSTPVVSDLKYSNVSFTAELERFQIMHQGIKDFYESPIVNAAYKYLEVLKHTPLHVQGINFNINLIKYQDSSSIKEIFEDPIAVIAKYVERQDEYLIDVKMKMTKDKRATHEINSKYYIDSGVSVSINFKKLNEELVLNFNQEIEKLNTDRSRIQIIKENYPNISKRFLNFIEALKK